MDKIYQWIIKNPKLAKPAIFFSLVFNVAFVILIPLLNPSGAYYH